MLLENCIHEVDHSARTVCRCGGTLGARRGRDQPAAQDALSAPERRRPPQRASHLRTLSPFSWRPFRRHAAARHPAVEPDSASAGEHQDASCKSAHQAHQPGALPQGPSMTVLGNPADPSFAAAVQNAAVEGQQPDPEGVRAGRPDLRGTDAGPAAAAADGAGVHAGQGRCAARAVGAPNTPPVTAEGSDSASNALQPDSRMPADPGPPATCAGGPGR